MPTSTFFNLPEAKRETLLAAARAEFCRVPFDKASIAKIIRDAGIPRGSFYMYFENKDDLLRYICSLKFQQFEQQALDLLARCNGDLFEMFLAAFDLFSHVPEHAEHAECVSEARDFVRINGGLILTNFVGFRRSDQEHLQNAIFAGMNRSQLRIDCADDLSPLLELLGLQTTWLIGQCHIGFLTQEEARQRLIRTIALVRDGVLRTNPMPPILSQEDAKP